VIPEGRRKRTYALKPEEEDAAPLISTNRESPTDARSTSSSVAPPSASLAPEAAHSDTAANEGRTSEKVLAYYRQQYLSSLSTKSPRWSFFSGIIHLGRTNSALMNILMANARYQPSALEKRREEDEFEALKHYQSGLRDLAGLVSSGQFDALTLLSTLFLLIQFEVRHAEHAEDVRSHLEGFTAAVLSHGIIPGLTRFDNGSGAFAPVSPEAADIANRYHNVLNRLGLLIVYMDAFASTWDLGGSVMETFLTRFPGSLEMMLAKSRDALKEIWGADYPPSEALDDLQNRPAFDLHHECHLLRYHVSLLRRSLREPDKANRLHAEIYAKLEKLSQVRNPRRHCCNDLSLFVPKQHYSNFTPLQQHSVLVDIASKWPNPDMETPRIVLNLRFIVPFFHAVQVEFYQLSATMHTHFPQIHPALARANMQRSLTAIVQIAAIVYENEHPNALCRIAWPLFVAGAESTDFAHQSWLLDRFRGLADFGVSFRRAHHLLQDIIAHRRQTGESIDYRRLVRESDKFEAFII